jgi:hypothetical protein
VEGGFPAARKNAMFFKKDAHFILKLSRDLTPFPGFCYTRHRDG